jgi:hypothetical protein
MAMPNNTLPMMTGFGQFGPIEMGGMFTLVKVREALGSNDYGDPGAYRNPEGTVAHAVEIPTAPIHRSAPGGTWPRPSDEPGAKPVGKPHR